MSGGNINTMIFFKKFQYHTFCLKMQIFIFKETKKKIR